jgi:hypothetical protein
VWGTRKGQHACLFIETLHRHISQQWHTIASSDTHLGFRVQGLWFMYTGTSRDSDTPLPPPTLLESLAASVFRTTARNTPTRQSVKQAKDKARRGARTHASTHARTQARKETRQSPHPRSSSYSVMYLPNSTPTTSMTQGHPMPWHRKSGGGFRVQGQVPCGRKCQGRRLR